MKDSQISVLLPLNVPSAFTYAVPEKLELDIGDFVTVPFGKKTIIGVVWSDVSTPLPASKLRQVISKRQLAPLSKEFCKFLAWVSGYTMSAPGNVLKMAISVPEALEVEADLVAYKLNSENAAIHNTKVSKARQRVLDLLKEHSNCLTLSELKEKSGTTSVIIKDMAKDGHLVEVKHPPTYKPEEIHPSQIILSENQMGVVNKLRKRIAALPLSQGEREVSCSTFSATLLDGVTGSGKTEVYLSAIEEIFKDETAQVLIMLPEIALTSQVINRFQRRFGFEPLTWHSGRTKSQKEKIWRKVANGGTRLIIGARSSLFLPFKNLKLIIIDEEHDSSYKQEEGVIYNARDMAVVRAKIENFPIILASATPSVETVENVKSGKYEWLHLPHRHGGAQMPDVSIIDMRNQKLDSRHFLSLPLVNAIRENIKNKQQSLLFMNRRGYAPLMLCRTCGFRFQCEECSTWLVQHKYGSYLMCHHCGFKRNLPKTCPECESENSLASCGPGVERIEEEVREYFPDSNIALMASDSLTNAKMAQMLEDILSGRVDIIIGTQVIAKGHHFPLLTLVGVVDGDLGLEGGDLRASERTYQLLHQVAGRAGREGNKGRVIIQSYIPGNAVIQALQGWDRDGFISAEMDSRMQNMMPPFERFTALIISGSEELLTANAAKQLVILAPKHNGIRVLGPVPAPIFMLRGKFRHRILIKSARNINIQKWLEELLQKVKIPSGVKVRVDIDPYSFF